MRRLSHAVAEADRARWRRRVGIEPTLRRFRAETTVLKTAEATRPHSPPFRRARVVTFARVAGIAYDSMFNLLSVFAFAAGAIVGSFLNVVIHRYPLEESVVFPPSRCPECGARIRWFDNVPILS